MAEQRSPGEYPVDPEDVATSGGHRRDDRTAQRTTSGFLVGIGVLVALLLVLLIGWAVVRADLL